MMKFDRRFLYAMYDPMLQGKEVFHSDWLSVLIQMVERADLESRNEVWSYGTTNFPFQFKDDCNCHRYCYYDPLYDIKLAKESGKKIEYRFKNSNQEWQEYYEEFSQFDEEHYEFRVVEEKQQSESRLPWRVVE